MHLMSRKWRLHRGKIFFSKTRFHSVMHRLGAILLYYKPLFMWSLLINILLISISPHIFIIILTKLFLMVLVLYFINETKTKPELLVCKNLNISQFRLFATLFAIDTLVTISFLKVLMVFT